MAVRETLKIVKQPVSLTVDAAGYHRDDEKELDQPGIFLSSR